MDIFRMFNKKFKVEWKTKIKKVFFFNYLYKVGNKKNILYLQIYDEDNILLWNKALEWNGKSFVEVDQF